MSFTVDIGFPEPIGASKTDNGVNFAVAVGDGANAATQACLYIDKTY